jgi:TolB-like protein
MLRARVLRLARRTARRPQELAPGGGGPSRKPPETGPKFTETAPGRLRIGGAEANLREGRIRASDGTETELRPQSAAVLRLLAARAGETVSKDELHAAVWGDIAVTEDSLVQCIGDIRRALGADRDAVTTVPRRGYRLEPPAAGRARRPWRGWSLAAAAVVAAGAAWWAAREAEPTVPPLVAVLPFEALSDDAAPRRLAAGLTDDLITDLTRFREFGVLAGNTTRGYADADPRRVRDELGVQFVVTGSIDRQEGTVRVTAQLADAATGGSLWSERWDRPAADLFAVQSEIAEAIANRLGGVVEESGRMAARRKPPESLTAYELYLLGTEQLGEFTRPGIEAAHGLLTRAVELDPGLARAWVELYFAHKQLANLGIDPDRNRALGVAAAERAVALDPSDPEAHVVHGSSYAIRDDFVRAETEYETALRMAPNSADILIAYIGWASSFGDAERGAELVERAIRLDPHYQPWANRHFAIAYFMAGRYGEAVTYFEKTGTERYARWSWGAHAGALASLGRRREAKAMVEQGLAEHPDLTIESIVSEPGWTEAERARLAETMRLAGFSACASREALGELKKPVRLPECTARADAGP